MTTVVWLIANPAFITPIKEFYFNFNYINLILLTYLLLKFV